MKIEFDEKTNTYKVIQDEPETAEMEASRSGISGTLDKVTNIEIAGIPLGQAAVGGALAILIDRLLLNRIDPEHKYGPFVLLGSALVVNKWGSKFLGKAAGAAALIMTYEAVADWLTMGIDKIAPMSQARVSQSYSGNQFRQNQGSMNQGELGIYEKAFS